ncbi:MAG: D-alanyl-D-alanine carboxypeptidase [Hyphomicrobiales bacterium]|nr:D-alanyl-D-alanine carboxypeptidase [Hyphomicrobiales bacterium]
MRFFRVSRRIGRSLPSLALCGLAAAFLVATAPAAEANPKYASIVIDAKTGRVLQATNADSPRYPASLTKMMTLYLLFEELDAGRLSLGTRMRVSEYASNRPPSKLGLRPGQTITVKTAILALVTKSANDVASVVAEHIGGSESNFARKMTAKARVLGMSRTTFKNASGLPHSEQKTTARDMARLGRALQERFPEYYKYFSTRSFRYGKRQYANHNRLLGRVKGVDGIKTGYTRASGFNLVSSQRIGKRHVIAVVMGGKTGRSRNAQMAKLLDRYTRRASTGRRTIAPVYAAATPVPESRPAAKVAELTSAPLPTAKPTRTITASAATAPITVTSSIKARATTHASAYAAESRPGWIIQIGAMPTKRDALDLINEARTKASGTLNGTSHYTETVAKGETTLWRARFAGFRSKKTAWDACAQLQRQDFSCLALSN